MLHQTIHSEKRSVKKKKCKAPGCTAEFVPFRTTQRVCSVECAAALGKIEGERQARREAAMARKELRERKERAKPRGKWMSEAQGAVNAYCRWRDEHLPCISCGKYKESWDAGHFRARSVSGALRFHELNIHRQCVQCNRSMHGNLIEFRLGLIWRYGILVLEWLEGPHDSPKYSIPDLREIKTRFVERLRLEQREILKTGIDRRHRFEPIPIDPQLLSCSSTRMHDGLEVSQRTNNG